MVLNNYVLENGMSVSVDELKKRWVKLKAKSNFREFFACFVPKIQIEHLGRMTVPGDIVLYNGNAISVFYNNSSWSYTRLGHINLDNSELNALLNKPSVTFVIKGEEK